MPLLDITEKLFNIAKQSNKAFFIVGMFCAAIIFLSEYIGTVAVRESLNPYLKAILVLCSIGVTINATVSIYGWIANKYTSHKRLSAIKEALCNLSAEEKEILSKYREFEPRSQSLDVNVGAVASLKRSGIIFESTDFADWGSFCQHEITPFARKYINENSNLLGHKVT